MIIRVFKNALNRKCKRGLNKKSLKVISIFLGVAMVLSATGAVGSVYAEVVYMENVTEEMTEASYWFNKTEDAYKILATQDEIQTINQDIIVASGTGVANLKNVSETVNGITLNQQLLNSADSDISYFLSIASTMFTNGGAVLTSDSFTEARNNTQNPSPEAEHHVEYGIVTTGTTLRSLPTDMMILDEQTDYNFDYLYLSSINVNEPVIIKSVSADGEYYYVGCSFLGGWIKASDVAVCKDKEEWLDAWDIAPEDVFVVYGDKVTTEETRVGAEVSKRVLSMGTILKVADESEWTNLITNRAAYYNHVVWLPVRNDDGSYSKSLCLIPIHSKTREGYMPLNSKNLANVAFNMLGNTYGWGGMLSSNDCSGYVRDIYRCFGFNLGRNTTNQINQPVKKYDVTSFSTEEKEKLLGRLPLGSVLLWGGHEMMYLGCEDGKYYVINSVSSVRRPDGNGNRVRSIIINTVDIKRPNGISWLDTITTVEIPFIGMSSPGYDYDYLADPEEENNENIDNNDSNNNSNNIDKDKQENKQENKQEDKKDNSSDKESNKDSDKKDAEKYKSEWVKGQWYDDKGKTDYKPKATWKNNSTGWWYEDSSGWYAKSEWQKIDGLWYYFGDDGYMASQEWIGGYWLDEDGACRYEGVASWRKNSTGWWYGDNLGWYAQSQWQKIDGTWYYFKSSGYLQN